ncbi:MAG: ABC-F family ATP-binding cassette domain-containing protein [Christensenellaceae bacterium]|nr:ABC-F family ATP-binding cassette domain-containing protein [Christensenellaceae bacterium]
MITIKNIEKTIGIRHLFSIESLSINPYDKIALIGDNGTGKTTFINMLSNEDNYYSGTIHTNIKIHKIDWENRAEISNRVFSVNQIDVNSNLSPGQMYKLVLQSALEKENTYLLMDEPTSHLDFETKDELIRMLSSRNYGFLLISHDRDFIQKTCNKIIEIKGGEFQEYNGSYQFYLEESIRRDKHAQREYESYTAEADRLKGVINTLSGRRDRIKTTPKRFGNSEARLHKMGGQGNKKKVDKQIKAVKSRIEQLEVKDKPAREAEIRLAIPEKSKTYAKVLLNGDNINKAYGENVIFSSANFEILNNSKVALLGANGSGKTTLINMILQNEGIETHPRLKIGYFSQLEDILALNKTIIENLMQTSIYDETMVRIILARMGIRRDDVYKRVDILSDGEKAKVKLCKILTSGFNFLILDEPTNHFDIHTIEALEELLIGYTGSILFVSHDRVFIDSIADTLLIIEDKKLVSFKGNLAEYQKPKEISEDYDLLLDYKIAAVNSKLSMDISKEERAELEAKYKELVSKKRGL